jgi:hypothetical protein
LDLGEHLGAGSVVPRDPTGHDLVDLYGSKGPNRQVVVDVDPLPARGVIETDAGGTHRVHLADRLSEVRQGGAPGAAQEDVGQGSVLRAVGAFVDVEGDSPGRAGLVGVETPGQDDLEAGQVKIVGPPTGDQPGQREVAHSVGGSATRSVPLSTAGADGVAVAGLEVRTFDLPQRGSGHRSHHELRQLPGRR